MKVTNWVEIAKKSGFEVHGVSLWVISHGYNSYSAAKALGVCQNAVYRWLHTPEKKLRGYVCVLFRVLNGIDARGGDSRDYI